MPQTIKSLIAVSRRIRRPLERQVKSQGGGIWRTTDDGNRIFIDGAGEVRAGGPAGPILKEATKKRPAKPRVPKTPKAPKAENQPRVIKPAKAHDQFHKLAMSGKVQTATGKKLPGEETAESWYEAGKINGYTDADIAHFYTAMALQDAGLIKPGSDFDAAAKDAIQTAPKKITDAAKKAFDEAAKKYQSKQAGGNTDANPAAEGGDTTKDKERAGDKKKPPAEKKPREAKPYVPKTLVDKAIAEYIDSTDRETVVAFKEFVDQAHAMLGDKRNNDRYALRETLSAFGMTGSKASGWVGALRFKDDYTEIEGFDEMAEYAAKYHPELLSFDQGESSGEGDIEQAFFARLQQGFPYAPGKDSQEVLDQAAQMAGPSFFADATLTEYEKASEEMDTWDKEELADLEDSPF